MSLHAISTRLTANGVPHFVVSAGKGIDVDPKIVWDLLAQYRKTSGVDLTTKITKRGGVILVVRETQEHASPEFKSPARIESWLRSAIKSKKSDSESRYGNAKHAAARIKN